MERYKHKGMREMKSTKEMAQKNVDAWREIMKTEIRIIYISLKMVHNRRTNLHYNQHLENAAHLTYIFIYINYIMFFCTLPDPSLGLSVYYQTHSLLACSSNAFSAPFTLVHITCPFYIAPDKNHTRQ